MVDMTAYLSREQCVAILESICIQCYDNEDVAALREAVRVNIEDGTLPPDVLNFDD